MSTRTWTDSMGVRLWLTTLACALALTGLGFAGLTSSTSSPPRKPDPTPRYAQTKVSGVGGRKEAEAAGVSAPESGQDSRSTWSVTGKVIPSSLEMDAALVPTAHGPIAILSVPASSDPDVADDAPPMEASLVGLDPQTGEVRWYQRTSPAVDIEHIHNAGHARWLRHVLAWEAIAVSADGEYAAFRLDLQPTGHNDDDAFSEKPPPSPSQAVVVLSTKTGELMRTVETTGDNILGQALTNDSLIILTSSTYHPKGGQISTYPLTDPEAPADTWEATGWLAGATANSAILSSTVEREPCDHNRCFNATVTLNDPTTGAVQNTYDRVTTIHPDGGIERLADGQEPPPPTPEDKAPWNAAHRELVDLHTGTTTDITGHEVSVTVTPTGRAWLLSTPKTDKQGTTARSWLPIGSTRQDAAPPTPSTDPLEIVSMGPRDEDEDKDENGVIHITRTTVTMTPGG